MTKSAPAKIPAKNKVTKSRTVAGFMLLFSLSFSPLSYNAIYRYRYSKHIRYIVNCQGRKEVRFWKDKPHLSPDLCKNHISRYLPFIATNLHQLAPKRLIEDGWQQRVKLRPRLDLQLFDGVYSGLQIVEVGDDAALFGQWGKRES